MKSQTYSKQGRTYTPHPPAFRWAAWWEMLTVSARQQPRQKERASTAIFIQMANSKHCTCFHTYGIASITRVYTSNKSNTCNKYNFVEQNKTSEVKFVVPGLLIRTPRKPKNKKSKFWQKSDWQKLLIDYHWYQQDTKRIWSHSLLSLKKNPYVSANT